MSFPRPSSGHIFAIRDHPLRHSREITQLCSPNVIPSGRRSARRFGWRRHAAFAADDNATQLATGNMRLTRLGGDDVTDRALRHVAEPVFGVVNSNEHRWSTFRERRGPPMQGDHLGRCREAVLTGVANVIRWPKFESTRQLTATSVGSKSLLGNGKVTWATDHFLLESFRVGDECGPPGSEPLAFSNPLAALMEEDDRIGRR